MHVGARVGGVVLEDGDRVRAQLRAIADHLGEERRHVREERRLARLVEPLVDRRHQLNLRADGHLAGRAVLHARARGLRGIVARRNALLLGQIDHAVHLLRREKRRLAHIDLCIRQRFRVVDRRHAGRIHVVLERLNLVDWATVLILAEHRVVLVVLLCAQLDGRQRLRIVGKRDRPVQVKRHATRVQARERGWQGQ